MIVAGLTWIPRGVAKESPEFFQPSAEQMEAFLQFKKNKTDIDDDDTTHTTTTKKPSSSNVTSSTLQMADDQSTIDSKYNLDDYDDDSSDDMITFSQSAPYYKDPKDDPNLAMNSDSDSDRDDLLITPFDDLIVSVVTENEEASRLEVSIYEEEEDNLYVHHDVMLPALPLCVEWMNFRPGQSAKDPIGSRGNIAAVGSFLPTIELWDLDVMESIEPVAMLGGKLKSLGHAKPNKQFSLTKDAHQDAVLGLSWNRIRRNLLASASADKTVKIWELQKQTHIETFKHHRAQVQSVQWNPIKPEILLTGSFDKTVLAFDVRQPKNVASRFKLSSDVESLCWNPFNENQFLASTDRGAISLHDIRMANKRIFLLSTHGSKEISTVQFNPRVPNFFLSASTDCTVKLWAIENKKVPSCLQTISSPVGKVFSAQFSHDNPFLVVMGGTNLHVFDALTSSAVRNAFATQADKIGAENKQKKMKFLESISTTGGSGSSSTMTD